MLMREVDDFFEEYRRAFERREARAVADLFVYPLALVADHGISVRLRTMTDRAEWTRTLEALMDSYALWGVASARIASCTCMPVGERLAQATLRWLLETREGEPVYGFSAFYVLLRQSADWRIAVVAHDEIHRSAALRRGGLGPSHDGSSVPKSVRSPEV